MNLDFTNDAASTIRVAANTYELTRLLGDWDVGLMNGHSFDCIGVVKASKFPATSFEKRDSNHCRLNNDLGKPDDPATAAYYRFLDQNVGAK